MRSLRIDPSDSKEEKFRKIEKWEEKNREWYTKRTPISIPTIRGIQALGVVGTTVGLGSAVGEVMKSPDPVTETVRQGSLFTAAIIGGARATQLAIGPCSGLGSMFPPAAPYTVPICLATASIAGGWAASSTVGYAWDASFPFVSTAEASPLEMKTKTLPQKEMMAMKAINYGVYKKNTMMQELNAFPQSGNTGALSGFEYLLNDHHSTDQKSFQKPAPYLKKSTGALEDLIWKQLLEKKPPLETKKSPLKNGPMGIFDSLEKSDLNERMAKALNDPLMNQYHLSHAKGFFRKLSPESCESLENAGNHLLFEVKKQDPTFKIGSHSDLVRHPVFYNELLKFSLTPAQAGLLTLYIGSEYDEKKIGEVVTSPKPSHALVQKQLTTLEDNIRKDLSEKDRSQSILFSTMKGKIQEGYQLAHSGLSSGDPYLIDDSVSDLELKKPHERQLQVERIRQRSQEISAIGQLGSQIASLTGNPRTARKINALTSGVSSSLTAFSMISAGSAIMSPLPLLSLGITACSAIGSFLNFFDDDDDDDGLSEYLGTIYQDMTRGFDLVLNEQRELATRLSHQMTHQHQAVMGRFDHVDESLYLIQQTVVQAYRQLSQQQALISQRIDRVSHQIMGLSHQLCEMERHIMLGLQTIHTHIMKNFQVLGEMFTVGLKHLDQRLADGLTQISGMNKELGYQMAEYALEQKQWAQCLLYQQQKNTQILQENSLQLQETFSRSIADKHEETQLAKKKLISQYTEFAERILGDYPIDKLDDSRMSKIHHALEKSTDPALTGSLRELKSVSSICQGIGRSDQWAETSPFDVINLLRLFAWQVGFDKTQREAFDSPLFHMTIYQLNIAAYLKRALYQRKEIDPEKTIQTLKYYAEQGRGLLRFCHALSNPKTMESFFKQAELSVKILGKILEEKLAGYQQELTTKTQLRLHSHLSQQNIAYARLKKEDSKAYQEVLLNRKKEINELKMQFFGQHNIQYRRPISTFVRPSSEEKTQYALLLTEDKWRPIPGELLQLEALGIGFIDFHYRYVDKQLVITTEFQFSQINKSFVLGTQSLAVENEEGILSAWKEFKNPAEEAIKLSEADQAEIESILNNAFKNGRLQFNEQLKKDFRSIEIQKQIESVEAHAGLLNMVLKLMFEAAYQDPTHPVFHMARSLVTDQMIENYLTNYSGQTLHPITLFSEKNLTYQPFFDQLRQGLEQRTLTVDNISLNNILLLIDQVILELLPPERRKQYLDEVLMGLPESAKAMYYCSRASLSLTSNLKDACENYTKALELHPNDAFIRLNLAAILLSLGDWRKAIEAYNHLIDQALRSLKLMTEFEEGNKEEIPLVKKLKKLSYLNLLTAVSCRGDAYAMGQFYPAASGEYNRACELLPNHPGLLYKRAYNFECMGQYALAQKDYESILKIQEDSATALEGLARCLAAQRQNAKALACYLQLIDRFGSISGLKIPCIKLAEKEDPRIEGWLKIVINDPSTSVDDLLFCAQFSAEQGSLGFAQLAYDNAKDHPMTTHEQYELCAEINVLLGDIDEFIINKETAKSILPIEPALKPPQRWISEETRQKTEKNQTTFDYGLFGQTRKNSGQSHSLGLFHTFE